MNFGVRLLKSIGLTVGSTILFWVIATVYYGIMFVSSGGFSVDGILEALQNSVFLTAVVFGALLYFPAQVALLFFRKLTRFFLLIFPQLMAITAVAIALYYLILVPTESRPISDSFLYEYLRLGMVGFVFVTLNNIFFVRDLKGVT